jgi:hypothetical protein
MAAGADDRLSLVLDKEVGRHPFVAALTVVLEERTVPRDDAQHLDVLQGEGRGVAESIVRFGHPLPHDIVGKMAVIAGGAAVAPCAPTVVMPTHDVTVLAVGGIIEKVRIAPGVPESESSHSDHEAQPYGKRQRD